MRYNLESTLPINAFSPRGGRSPFNHGMTLEGGGGGFVGKAIGSVAKAVTGAVKSVVQPVYNATLKNIPGVDAALVGLDKSVSNAIPGGWGTLASVAASFIPGAQLAALNMTQTGLATGLGALTGSGVMRKGNQFNLQGALMGGAAAYGLSSLGEYAKAAANPATVTPTVDTSGALSSTGGSALTGTGAGYTPSDFLKNTSIGADAVSGSSSLTPTANALSRVGEFTPPPAAGPQMFSAPSELGSFNPTTSSGITASLPPAGAGASGVGTGGFTAPPSLLETAGSKIANAADALTTGSNYVDTVKGMGSNIADTGAGIKNLIFGPNGTSALASAASGVNPSLAGAAALYGTAGLAALEEQRNYLDQQLASNNVAQSEYNAQVAEIDRQIAIARQAMKDNPWNLNPDRTASMDPTSYERTADQYNLYERSPSNLYANEPTASGSTFTAARGGIVPGYCYDVGGSVDDESGLDEARGLYQGNMSRGFMDGGVARYARGGKTEDNLPELNDVARETDFEGMPEPSRLRLMGTPSSFIETPYVKGVTGRVGGVYALDRDTQLTAGLGGFAGRTPSGYTVKPDSADLGFIRRMGPGYLAAQYQRNLTGNRAGDRIMANYAIPFAEGGQPRFLSGGGDGMSDSIPANINGKQEARLADGEFVIPADVVSHLGNGSSKAGAKRLYSMMDKVRTARTGTKKQGKQINPNKYLPA